MDEKILELLDEEYTTEVDNIEIDKTSEQIIEYVSFLKAYITNEFKNLKDETLVDKFEIGMKYYTDKSIFIISISLEGDLITNIYVGPHELEDGTDGIAIIYSDSDDEFAFSEFSEENYYEKNYDDIVLNTYVNVMTLTNFFLKSKNRKQIVW